MENKPQKKLDELIQKQLETSRRQIELAAQLIAATKEKLLEYEKSQLEEDRNNAHLDNFCKSCDNYHSCQKLKYRISERLNICVALRFNRSYSKATPRVLLPENNQSWTSVLNNFLQYHTQYDSGLPGMGSTHESYLKFDRNGTDLLHISESKNN